MNIHERVLLEKTNQQSIKKGQLKIITGCMFTEKSFELIETAKELDAQGKDFLAFSPIKNVIKSRALQETVPAHMVDKDDPLLLLYYVGGHVGAHGKVDTILIDEVQFYGDSILSIINTLLDQGINIVAAGLDKTFKNEPFGIMRDLLCFAYDIKKKHTRCAKCGNNEASVSQRLLNDKPAPFDGPMIILDKSMGEYTYEPRCVDCFQQA